MLDVGRVLIFSVSPHSPSLFLHSLQTFRSNMDAPSLTVARVRKKIRLFCSLLLFLQSIFFFFSCFWKETGSTNTRPISSHLDVIWDKEHQIMSFSGDIIISSSVQDSAIVPALEANYSAGFCPSSLISASYIVNMCNSVTQVTYDETKYSQEELSSFLFCFVILRTCSAVTRLRLLLHHFAK